ncbi:HAD domain-containing protein [Nocardia sp. JMUB6875]|uniref:hypothetical protein n=1 Tax=Nocardia sp. JMUB6875 TaxID=3158170 RepID=UPI0032E5D888
MDGTLLPRGTAGLSRLTPALGARLLALHCDLRWATGWGARANVDLSPLLGFPQLPVVVLPEYPIGDYYPDELHWKTRTLVAQAAGRPFIWIDDEIRHHDRTWVAANHPAPALLVRVDPVEGLGDTHFALVTDWLRAER